MLGAIANTLSQLLSPPFRAVLLKSVGAALAVLVVLGIGLQRLLSWAVGSGGAKLETWAGGTYGGTLNIVELVLTILASVGLFAGLVFLMPAVTTLVASFFADEIAQRVEEDNYPADPPGRPLPVARALFEGVKTALLALLVYMCAVPFLFVAGVGVLVFFFATAFLLGREYFELAAMRFHSPAEARALRKANAGRVFTAGMAIAAFVSIPIVNLATPLFGTALMVHIHKRLPESRGRLDAPRASGESAGE
ncbi:MAG: sulfate transporter family protein [Rhizobiales bacterium]|nr:sulfate transporter family protein [Hyphomicrobiales bacterium]